MIPPWLLSRLPLRRLYVFKRLWWRITRPQTIGVRLIPVDRHGRLLLIRHTYVRGWYFPGGATDRGETMKHAALRELLEEVGLTADDARLIDAQTFFLAGRTDHVILYAAQVEGSPQPNGWEIEAARFFDRDDLPSLPPVTQALLDAWLSDIDPR
ncbi:MAG: NUDIX domain-containing protein [Myxococcota bacterium]